MIIFSECIFISFLKGASRKRFLCLWWDDVTYIESVCYKLFVLICFYRMV